MKLNQLFKSWKSVDVPESPMHQGSSDHIWPVVVKGEPVTMKLNVMVDYPSLDAIRYLGTLNTPLLRAAPMMRFGLLLAVRLLKGDAEAPLCSVALAHLLNRMVEDGLISDRQKDILLSL